MIHLKRFCIEQEKVIKDNQFLSAFLMILFRSESLTATKLPFFNSYSLVATINHSGSLNNGHYWAIVKYDTTNRWFSCNDKVVFEIKADDLSNKTSYVLFYVKKRFSFYFNFISVSSMQGGFVDSDIVFGCDDPTHNPSSVWMLSLLTQFSGLTTLQSLVSGEALQGGLTKLALVFEE